MTSTADITHTTGFRAWLDTTSGIVAMLLAVQFLTGILLAFYYVPSVDHAYATVAFIENVVSSGAWIRSLHHYGSQWLTLFLFLHVVRLFLSKAYIAHSKQWIAAIVLLGLVMAGGGTGYSLPWDARAFFSTRVAEGLMAGLPFAGGNARLWLLGGSQISTITLSRFFALHVLVVPGLIVAVVVWSGWRWPHVQRNVIAAGVAFIALALWCLKFNAPLGPSTTQMTADFLPRPGPQFLWLYQSLKYVPGGVASIIGLVLPGVALLLLIVLGRLRQARLIGAVILGGGALLIVGMTAAAYVSDYKNPRVTSVTSSTNTAPELYIKWCANCHGRNGEGAQQGQVRFPALTGVATKPRRTVDDIVGILKDPEAYGLLPPMRSFSSKMTEPEMRTIARWVHGLR